MLWTLTDTSLYPWEQRLRGVYSEASFIRDAFIWKHRYPDVFLGNEKTQRNFAPFSRKSVFPEPDSSLGNQTMFYNDQRSVLSGHAPECHWLQG